MNKEREAKKSLVSVIVRQYKHTILPPGSRTYKNFARILSSVLQNSGIDITINHQTIWNWEKALTLPRKDTLQLISRYATKGMWQQEFANKILEIL